MFLTTMRVRRARSNTLAEHQVRGSGDLVEVTCHGEAIAVVALGENGGKVLWIEGQYKKAQPQVLAVVDSAVAVMTACPANRQAAA